MAVLTNKSIASTYKSVLSIGATTESALTTSIQQLTDGLGNSSPLSMSTTQIQFNNDANTFSFPADRGTSGQILKLADANGTLSWADDDLSNTLDFSGGTGTGSVTLDTQTLAFTGTANQIVTSASSQAITLSFPTAGVTLPDGSVATTQTASNNSTKVATTAYVDNQVSTAGTVTSVALSVPTGLTVTNSPITTSGTITIGGTLGVANGGTGATTLTGILLGNGTSAISAVTDGTTSGQVLSTNANGTYSFIDAAGGDVSISGTPSTNEVAIWTDSNTIKGDASFTMSSSTFQINNSTASSQSNLIISNNDTAINSVPANIIFNSNTLTSYKTLAQIYATKTDADIANASGKLNFATTDAGFPSVKFIINSNGLSEFFGNVNAYNTSSLKLYSLGQEGSSNTEFLEIKKSSTNAIFNVNKVGTGSVRGLEFQTGGSPKLTISSTGTATFTGASGVKLVTSSASDSRFDFANQGTGTTIAPNGGGWAIGRDASDGTNTDSFAIAYNATTFPSLTAEAKMRISSGGNVGIGVTPSAWYSGWKAIEGSSSLAIASKGLGMYVAENCYFNAATDWIYSTNAAAAYYQQYGDVHNWYSAPSGTAGNIIPFVNVMSIKSGGNIIFTSGYNKGEAYQFSFQGSSGNAGAFAALRVATNGDNIINFFNASDVFQGSISVNSGSVSYGSVSDYRLKENVTPITDALSRLNKLKPIRFNFIADSSQIYDGFIAHEVQEIIPEATSGEKDAMRDEEFELTPRIEEVIDEDGNVITEAVDAVMETRSVPDYQGIDQSKIVPLLTAAIQEQQTIIEDLKLRIEKLEG